MTLRADPALLPEIRKFGAFDVQACFNCGNCTAICPLSKDDDAFPRRMIRYAQLGLPAHLVASKELWLCHYCGECSDTCPREADPGEFMAAARRYAIARFDPSGLSRWLTIAPWKATAVLIVIAALLGALFLAFSPGVPAGPFSTAGMLTYIPYELIHWCGIGVFAIMGAVALITIANLTWGLAHAPRPSAAKPLPRSPGLFPGRRAWRALVSACAEVFGHRSFRTCAEDPQEQTPPWYQQPWFVHLAIMLGFLGLGAATALDYAFKDPMRHVGILSPIRLLGTLAGLLFVYGATSALVRRFRKADRASSSTRFSDWVFLLFLWATGVSGFAIEIAIYLDTAGSAALYAIFLVHIVLAMELLLLLPFTKFAHALYRPIALFVQGFKRSLAPELSASSTT